jgi:hypothetical protein
MGLRDMHGRERGRKRGDRAALEHNADFRRAMEDRPQWVTNVWATPLRRLGLSLAFLAIAMWIVVDVLSDPDTVLRRPLGIIGLVAAPALLLGFGAQATQAVLDVVRGRNSFPILFRVGWWLDRRGLPITGLYVVAMVAVILGLRT